MAGKSKKSAGAQLESLWDAARSKRYARHVLKSATYSDQDGPGRSWGRK